MSALLSFLAGILAKIVTTYLQDLRRDRALTDAGRLEAERDAAAAAARKADDMAKAAAAVQPGDAVRRMRNGTF